MSTPTSDSVIAAREMLGKWNLTIVEQMEAALFAGSIVDFVYHTARSRKISLRVCEAALAVALKMLHEAGEELRTNDRV